MEKTKSGFFGEVTRGAGIAVIFTLAAVLLFAFIIKIANLDSSVIKPVNQFLKVLSIFVGCYFALSGSHGLLKGLLTGLLTVALTCVIFAIISGGINFDVKTLLEALFGMVIGAVSGVITVNLKK